jgi:predicted TIM-barrel fold metal-dependent hydrolase
MIIDTHLHLIDKSALNYPWLGDVPALNRDFLFETYRKQAERCGIKAALHMEVDVSAPEIVAETAHIMAISGQNNGYIKGAIASCRPEEPGFAEYLEQSRSNPFIKGFRRVLHVVPDNVSEGALFRENIKRLEGTGLTFDLCTLTHQIDKVLALAVRA